MKRTVLLLFLALVLIPSTQTRSVESTMPTVSASAEQSERSPADSPKLLIMASGNGVLDAAQHLADILAEGKFNGGEVTAVITDVYADASLPLGGYSVTSHGNIISIRGRGERAVTYAIAQVSEALTREPHQSLSSLDRSGVLSEYEPYAGIPPYPARSQEELSQGSLTVRIPETDEAAVGEYLQALTYSGFKEAVSKALGAKSYTTMQMGDCAVSLCFDGEIGQATLTVQRGLDPALFSSPFEAAPVCSPIISVTPLASTVLRLQDGSFAVFDNGDGTALGEIITEASLDPDCIRISYFIGEGMTDIGAVLRHIAPESLAVGLPYRFTGGEFICFADGTLCITVGECDILFSAFHSDNGDFELSVYRAPDGGEVTVAFPSSDEAPVRLCGERITMPLPISQYKPVFSLINHTYAA